MEILMISSIIPSFKIQRNNDIILKTINDIQEINPKINFCIIQPIIYSNRVLGYIKAKWEEYYEKIRLGDELVMGHKVSFFPWIAIYYNFSLLSSLSPLNWIYHKKRIYNIIGEKKYDIIHAQNFFPDGYTAMRLSKELGIPYFVTVRGFTQDMLKNKTIVKILLNANQIITPSPYAFRSLTNNYNVKLIPHGVDEDYFTDIKKDFTKLRIITVSMLIKLKNIDKVLIALSVLAKKKIDFEYRILGEGQEYDTLKELVNSLGLREKVKFLGHLDKEGVIKQYRWSNLFIMPSYPETIGRVYLEAAASNNVIIGTKDTGIDGILKDRESAFFVHKECISKDIVRIIKNLNVEISNEIATNANKHVKEFHIQKVISKYLKTYVELK